MKNIISAREEEEEFNEESPNHGLLALPRDVTAMIMQKLGALQMLTIAPLVCTQWRNICNDPSTWHVVKVTDKDIESFRTSYKDSPFRSRVRNSFFNVGNMFQKIVERSCSCLVDLELDSPSFVKLICYGAKRCTKIRRLRLSPTISKQALQDIGARLPLLEDLEVHHLHNFSGETLEILGKCCPRLESLKLNCIVKSSWRPPNDKEAEAIAKSMPKLRHLQLIANDVSNLGVEAIINGCPDLESLDLRQCFHVDPDGILEKIRSCAPRIKHFRGPMDSIHDYAFADRFVRDNYL